MRAAFWRESGINLAKDIAKTIISWYSFESTCAAGFDKMS